MPGTPQTNRCWFPRPAPRPLQEPFLRALVPFFPAKRGDVRVRMPGATREQDCSTFSLFIPEINLAGLTADGGRGLLDLYEQAGRGGLLC